MGHWALGAKGKFEAEVSRQQEELRQAVSGRARSRPRISRDAAQGSAHAWPIISHVKVNPRETRHFDTDQLHGAF